MKNHCYLTLSAFALSLSLNAQTSSSVSLQDAEKRIVVREMEKTIDGKNWVLTLKNDKVEDVTVNGEKLAKSSWSKYQNEIDDLKASAYKLDSNNANVSKDISIESGELTSEQKSAQNAIEDELLKQGLIKTKNYKLTLSDKAMILDGKTLSKEVMNKFIKIYYTYTGESQCDGCTFKFQVDKQEGK